MEWKYVKALVSENLINEFEGLVGYKFPKSFCECVVQNNGGRPQKRIFDTDRKKERALKSFLSFNKEDRETVWKINDWNKEELAGKYVAFSIDNFGNLICFEKESGKVVFVELENQGVELVADDFDGFINKLYEE